MGFQGGSGAVAFPLGELLSVLKQDAGVSEGAGRAARRVKVVQKQEKLPSMLRDLQTLLAAAQKVLGLAETIPGN